MKRVGLGVLLLGSALLLPGMAHAQQDWQRTLGGLLTGDQREDNSLRQAYQRGYQRGRDDQAQAMNNHDRRDYRDDSYDRRYR